MDERCTRCGATAGWTEFCAPCAAREARRIALAEVQALLVEYVSWEERGRNVLALVTEVLTRPGL